jgi:alpha-amylase
VFKQKGLDQQLQFDAVRRKSLVDHFYDHDVTLEAVSRCEATELGDFATGDFDAMIRRNDHRIQVQLHREGRVGDHTIKLTKGITLNANSSTLEITYLLDNLPEHPLHFGVELNFAGMPAAADDRYFYHGDNQQLGQLGTQMDLSDIQDLALVDQWLGLDVQLTTDRPTNFWTFPIESVSQSEGGFEAVHQSVVVQPHWFVQPNEQGQWSVNIRLTADTSMAENRANQQAEPALN